ncbi:MAG: MFS transporter, partial [Myxococcota bacterium]
MGLGIGLYWPAVDAVIADVTEGRDRNEAYALTRLADNIGLQLGIIFGGVVISTTGAYRSLFVIDGVTFLAFFAIVYFKISETYKPDVAKDNSPLQEMKNGWSIAFSDRPFIIFIVVNIIFTFCVSQIHTTLPLYLTNVVPRNLLNKEEGWCE